MSNLDRGRQRAITILAQMASRPATMTPAEWMDDPRNTPLHTEHPEVLMGYELVRNAAVGTMDDVVRTLQGIAMYDGFDLDIPRSRP